MKYKVLISEGEDGWYVVECPSIPGCVSQGKSLEEALENIKDAIQGCLDVLSKIANVNWLYMRLDGWIRMRLRAF